MLTVDAGVADAVLLSNRNGRTDALDGVDVRLLHPLEKLTRVGRQRLDVAPLALGVDRVEGERRLARPADPGHHDQRPLRDGQSTFLRLWVRAPRTTMLFLASRVGGIYSVLFWQTLTVHGSAPPPGLQPRVTAFGSAGTERLVAVARGPCYFVGAKVGPDGTDVPFRRALRVTHEGVVSVRLFIGNLPYSATEPDLREHLSSVGAPAQIVLPTDRETGRPRGFALSTTSTARSPKKRSVGSTSSHSKADRWPSAKHGPGNAAGRASAWSVSAARVRAVHLRGSAVPGQAASRRDRLRAAALEASAAATSARMRHPKTSASRTERIPTAVRKDRSRSARSDASTTPTRTGEPKTRSRTSRSTISRPARRRMTSKTTKARWTPTSVSSAS